MSNIDARLLALLAEAEVTYALDPTPDVATNAVMPRSFSDSPEINEIDKPRVDAKHRTVGKQIASIAIPLEVEFEAVGSTASPLPVPMIHPFLLASGMAVTPSGGPPVNKQTYVFSSLAAQASLTLYAYKFRLGGAAAALLHRYYGCRFAWEVTGGVDAPMVWKFAGMGLFGGTIDATPTVASLAYPDEVTDGANGKACTLTIGAVATDVKSFTIKAGREVMRRDSIRGTYGVAECFITASPGFVHEITLDREVKIKADLDHWTEMLAEGKVAWSLSWTSAAGAKVTISGTKLQAGAFSYEDDGILRLSQTFYACDDTNAGDDALKVEFE
jgi:hypothetical protein